MSIVRNLKLNEAANHWQYVSQTEPELLHLLSRHCNPQSEPKRGEDSLSQKEVPCSCVVLALAWLTIVLTELHTDQQRGRRWELIDEAVQQWRRL